jgi:3-hydroxyisobutyrate dehydrogenase-like beta-hydroxyacid dehydrogenase
MKIGFVGTGQMGSGMARNLLRAGHQVTVYNRTRDKAEALAADGARVADSAAEAAKGADAVFSMLADDHAASQAVLSENGIAAGLAPGAAHISSSTISVNMAKKLEAEHNNRKQIYVSAPVFGRPEAAEAKKLIVVPAGPPDAVQHFQSAFEAIGRATFIAGDQPWQANLIKLCGNFMIASMLETFGEAFAVVEKGGMQPSLFLDVMSELFGSPVYKNYGGLVVQKKFDPAGFALKLGFKDARLVSEAAQDLGAPLPIAGVLRDQFVSGIAHGQEQLDWSSIALVSRRAAGLG